MTSPCGERPAVLVVDDDPDVRDYTVDALDLAGYRVGSTPEAREAVEYLSDHPEVEVVITDIRRPGMTGLELTRHVRAHHGASVIVVTGFSADFSYEEILAEGAADSALKPLRAAELHARLSRVLAARAVDRERAVTRNRLAHSLDRLRRTVNGVVRAIAAAVEGTRPVHGRPPGTGCPHCRPDRPGHGPTRRRRGGSRSGRRPPRSGQARRPRRDPDQTGGPHPPGAPTDRNPRPSGLRHPAQHRVLWPVAETVYQHHERLDGSSYPQGLHSPEIRLEARILAVVDVLETIASHRPYHPAKRLDAALVEIADHRGSLYDVDVARTALGLAETGALADGVPAHALRHGLS